uniref:Uncharacterized protein n=1 Tax=Wolbachia endosymbiont of Aleurodicus dispersus TaxID=1288877 RepID=A0A3B0JJ17_9RICK
MLGQENIREQLAVDQMDVDELSNGEQHYEDRLSSEIECKLSCEFSGKSWTFMC